MTIRNPIAWGWDQCKTAARGVGVAGRSIGGTAEDLAVPLPQVRRIGLADLRHALAKGVDDFATYRTDVIFLCLVYPLAGLVLARLVSTYELVPLLFPLASGFALLAPALALGLYEMSRRRELDHEVSWATAFGVLGSPAFGAILTLGLMLCVLFLLWLAAAQAIYEFTLGPRPPVSLDAFAHDVLTTGAGHSMIAIGVGVGFLFAVLVLATSVVSFPLLLDRHVTVSTAIWTSLRAVAKNPGPMAVWGLIVAVSLVLGTIPLFLGLIIVLPVLGHATWHLYRRVVST